MRSMIASRVSSARPSTAARCSKRSSRAVSGTSSETTKSTLRGASIASSALACSVVRGKPSRSTFEVGSMRLSRLSTMRSMRSSGTRSPAAMTRAASLPTSLPWATSERRISPVDRCDIPNSRSTRAACVPLPLPGGPKMSPINSSTRRPALGQCHRPSSLPPPLHLFIQQLVHRGMRSRRPAGLAQSKPAPGDLDVNVGFRPARHLLQHFVPPYRLGDREIDRVVPARRGFGQGHRMAELQSEEVLVAKDVLEDLVVAAEPATFDPGLGPGPVQLRALQELRVLGRLQELFGVDIHAARRTGLHVDHPGVDRVATKAARNRTAVVAVDDVVAVADPINVDRWELAAFDHGGIHARPAIAQAPGGGQETGEEIARLGGRRGRADDLVDRDLLDAAERPSLGTRRLQDGIERHQPAGTPGQRVADRPPEAAEARRIEVLTGAYPLHIC